MIEVGTLVKYYEDGDLGIVTKIIEDPMYPLYWIKWNDGTEGDHLDFELEVIV